MSFLITEINQELQLLHYQLEHDPKLQTRYNFLLKYRQHLLEKAAAQTEFNINLQLKEQRKTYEEEQDQLREERAEEQRKEYEKIKNRASNQTRRSRR
tara:strand:- start:229 stop:522 length:294 start_codon:yes stop_codon:yes gene_type:complete